MDFSAAANAVGSTRTMNSESVLKARGIGKSVRSGDSELVILRDIELEITRGEALAVVGASGSGKSPLLAILACLAPRSGAEVISLLFDMNREIGTTLVLVTHDESLAARCGRVIRLAGGRIVP